MTATTPEDRPATPPGLAEALVKNTEATEAVQEVADELSVVHAVLTQEVADATGDAAGAVARTAELEKKLSETAEKMVEVNQALAEQHASLEHLNKAS